MLPLLLILAGCAKGPQIPGPLGAVGRDVPDYGWLEEPAEAVVSERQAPDPFGSSLADAARFYLDHDPDGFRDDCSGFVCAAASRAGWRVRGNTRALWDRVQDEGRVHRRKRPAIGDLAFFDNTYDRNGNGRLDDELTHVAVVVGIEPDGTVLLAHAGTSAGRSLLRMNLFHPDLHEDEAGTELNGWLRRRTRSDRAATPHLASECWRAFATVEPPREQAAW